jgi:hypothetical protein
MANRQEHPEHQEQRVGIGKNGMHKVPSLIGPGSDVAAER